MTNQDEEKVKEMKRTIASLKGKNSAFIKKIKDATGTDAGAKQMEYQSAIDKNNREIEEIQKSVELLSNSTTDPQDVINMIEECSTIEELDDIQAQFPANTPAEVINTLEKRRVDIQKIIIKNKGKLPDPYSAIKWRPHTIEEIQTAEKEGRLHGCDDYLNRARADKDGKFLAKILPICG